MNQGQPIAQGSAKDFDQAWSDVRGDSDIQFQPVEQPKPENPQWLEDLLRWLGEVLGPLGEMLGSAWPFIRILLLVALAAGVLALLYAVLRPYLDAWRERTLGGPEPDEWRPDEDVARELLREADALAEAGRYDEAAHLLLYRSIEDIRVRRPELLRPSSTAREIGTFQALPAKPRSMFQLIAGHVERSLFGRKLLDRTAWEESRNAYGEFALAGEWL